MKHSQDQLIGRTELFQGGYGGSKHPIHHDTGHTISFHVPGFQRHRWKVSTAESSKPLNPVDFSTSTRATSPVFGSIIMRNCPDPGWRSIRSAYGYPGGGCLMAS